MKLELSYIQNTQQRMAWPQRGGESTLTAIHICHRPRIPFGHVLIEHRCGHKHCKKREGCNKEKKDQTHHTNNNNKVPFQTTTKNKNNTCETCDPTNLELSYIFNNTPQRKAPWPQRGREREYTLTAIHICHRPCIPFGHVLIERRCASKHCKKREGCNTENKDQTHHNQQQRYHSKSQNEKNRTCEKCDPMKLELSIFKIHNSGVATEREREYTYCLAYMSPPPYSILTRPY